ncbi:MAG: hypothetical protein HYS12_27355 [Planctomycetes bacterium]|nr:hypothetical protein [Planctomycetota bacterium]
MLQRRPLFSLLLAAIVAGPALSQEATLEWKFAKDKPFYQTMTTTTTQNMTVTGTKVEQKQEQTFHFEWKPIKIDKDKVTLEQKIIGLKMNIDIGGSKIAYDSTAPQANPNQNNPLNKFFEALKDAAFTITLDTKETKVTNLEGHEKFVTKLIENNPQMKPLLEKILSKEALKDMAEPMFAALPGKKQKKNDTWPRKSTLDMGPIGKYETTYTYTYAGPDKDKNEKIDVKTDLKYTPPEAKETQGLPFRIKDASLTAKDSTGTIVYDPKAGWVKSSDMKMTLTGTLTIEIGNQSTAVDLTQEQTTKILTSAENPIKK